jgi:hypothetical protein
MVYFFIKCALSGIIIAVVSEVAKRSPALGALTVSLPLVSLLGILWLWRDTGDVEQIARHAESFWHILPSVPMFLVFSVMLRAGAGLWPSMGVVPAVLLYAVTASVLAKFRIDLQEADIKPTTPSRHRTPSPARAAASRSASQAGVVPLRRD